MAKLTTRLNGINLLITWYHWLCSGCRMQSTQCVHSSLCTCSNLAGDRATLQSQLQQMTSDEKSPVTVHLSQVLPDPSWKTSCSGCPGALYSSVLHATRFWDAVKGMHTMKGVPKLYKHKTKRTYACEQQQNFVGHAEKASACQNVHRTASSKY